LPKELSKSGKDGPPQRGPQYLTPHACFHCRKSWKQADESSHVCPDCGSRLANMGRHFKAPKRSSINEWQAVEKLVRAGFRFWSTRNYPDSEPLPGRLTEVEDFIDRNPKHRFKFEPPSLD
jgi:DNA-directed RNA polymerase subunit RPC12/RpoP